ncbi:MAG: beta-1,6-galactofuranosyltransferase [Oenococcus sp.]|uniref:beta-1,6-galactofuranosyltransferase n=1 Tax=Oenococcus sp. TaxID=1979414 RepID=UPI0039E963C3
MNWVTLTVEPWMPIGADKAKEDFAQIAAAMGFRVLKIDRARKKADLVGAQAGDLLIHQYPSYLGDDWELTFEHELQQKGILFGVLIHDFEPLRLTAQAENSAAFQIMHQADFLIVHNQRMADRFSSINAHIFKIQLFDYLTEHTIPEKKAIHHALVYAGSLVKAAWLKHYSLPIPLTVFGRVPRAWDFSASKTIQIKNPIDPSILPASLPAAWGLVWDEDLDPNKTHYQDYEKINSPHKLSLYLAAGIPVIVWQRSALAEFVREHRLGLLINDLTDISEDALSHCQINFDQLSKISKQLQRGYFSQKVLQKVIDMKKAIPDGCRPK